MGTTAERRASLTLYVVLGIVAIVGLTAVITYWRASTLREAGVQELGQEWVGAAGHARERMAKELRLLGAEWAAEDVGSGARSDHTRALYTATIALTAMDSMDRGNGRLELVLELGAGDSLCTLSSDPVVTCEVGELPPGMNAARVEELLRESFEGRAEVVVEHP